MTSDADQALTVAIGAALLSVLVYFADRQRGDRGEQAAERRDEESARQTTIAHIINRYHALMRDTGAAASLYTLRDAGIAELRSDADIREVIRRLAHAGKSPMTERLAAALTGVDLVTYFDTSIRRALPPDHTGQVLDAMREGQTP